MKKSYPCPECGRVISSNKCECGHELMPETPRPKTGPRGKKTSKKWGKGKYLKF